MLVNDVLREIINDPTIESPLFLIVFIHIFDPTGLEIDVACNETLSFAASVPLVKSTTKVKQFVLNLLCHVLVVFDFKLMRV